MNPVCDRPGCARRARHTVSHDAATFPGWTDLCCEHADAVAAAAAINLADPVAARNSWRLFTRGHRDTCGRVNTFATALAVLLAERHADAERSEAHRSGWKIHDGARYAEVVCRCGWATRSSVDAAEMVAAARRHDAHVARAPLEATVR